VDGKARIDDLRISRTESAGVRHFYFALTRKPRGCRSPIRGLRFCVEQETGSRKEGSHVSTDSRMRGQ
jgi:hypothetical protein